MKSTKTRGKKSDVWSPIFWPEEYVEDGNSLKLEDNKLDESKLEKLGIRVAKARKR